MDNLESSSGDPGANPNYLSVSQSMDKCEILCDYVLVTHYILNSSSITPLFISGNSNILYKYVTISDGGDNFVSAAIVGILVGIVAWMLISRGLNGLKASNLKLDRTAHSLQRDASVVKERL